MTYEDLLIAIDDAAPSLPGCALRLLLRLIAIAIKTGNNEVRISVRTLAAQMGVTKDAVAVATLSLKDVVQATSSPGVPSSFILPADWFAPQRSLFAIPGVVDNRPKCPGFQDTSGRETRTLVGEKPGHSVLKTRTQWANYQDTVGEKPGHLGEKPGHCVLKTRTLDTQNQQLTDNALRVESIDLLRFPSGLVDIVDRVVSVDRVEKHQQQDAEILRSLLSDYRAHFGEKNLASKLADDKIIGQCLAAGPIEQLQETLLRMLAEKKQPGESNAWFVTVLLDKLHQVPSELISERRRIRHPRKRAKRETDSQFGSDLINQTAARQPRLM